MINKTRRNDCPKELTEVEHSSLEHRSIEGSVKKMYRYKKQKMIEKMFESTSDVQFVRIPGEKFGRLSHESSIRIRNQYIDPSSVLQTYKQILQRTSLLIGHYLPKQ